MGGREGLQQEVRPALEALAEAAWELRDEDPARARTLIGAQLEQASHDPLGRAVGLIVQAFLSFREKRYDFVLEQAFKAQDLLGQGTSLVWSARLFNTLACTYLELGERALAFETYHKQLVCAQESGIPDEIFGAYHDLGLYFSSAGDPVRSLEFYEKARPYLSSDPSSNPRSKAFLELNLAYHYTDQAQFEEAKAHAEVALTLSRDILRLVEGVLEALAYIATRQGEHAEALRVYRELLQLETDRGLSSATTLLSLAGSELALGERQSALEHLKRALGSLEAGGSKNLLADCHKLLSEAYKRGGAFKRALEHHERFHAYHQAIFNESSETRVRALEVMHRMNSLKEESARLMQKNERLERHNEALRQLHERVHELSIRDVLTGLYNRRHLLEQTEQFVRLTNRYGHPLSVVLLDIDHFKQVNDTFGHKMGDAVLACIGEILRTTLRETDVTARYGGEEFAIVMPDTSLEVAALTCERLRHHISTYGWDTLHASLRVTVSIGVAASSDFALNDEETLFALADEQLYLSKRNGRDRVSFGNPVGSGAHGSLEPDKQNRALT